MILPRIRNDADWKCGSSVTSGSDSAKRRALAIFMAMSTLQSTMNSFAPVVVCERCGSAPSATW